MLPKGWIQSTLEDYVDIKHGFAFKSEFFASEGDYILMTPGHFYESGGFRDQGVKTKYYIGEIPKGYILEKYDVVLAMTEQAAGLLGSAAYVPEGNKYLHNQRLGLLKIKDSQKACVDFLYLIYNSPSIRKQITEQGSGTKVKHTSPDKLRGVITLIPPLPEQKKIAQILSTWDKAITTTEQLLANSQQQKKALMQQLLTGKKRLKGFGGEFKRSYLSDLAKIDAKSLGNKTPTDVEFQYISLSDVNAGRIADNIECHKFHNAPSRARRIVSEGDILLATVRPNLQGFAKITKEYSDCIASTGFSVLSPKKGVCGSYLYYYLFGAHITGQINALVVGTNYPAINSSDVAGLLIYYPEYEEQEKIAEILNNCDSIISVLQKKLEGLKQEKKALMQQLLTGKRRVSIN